MRGIYEYSYMSHHNCYYRFFIDEAISTTTYFDWLWNSYDVHRVEGGFAGRKESRADHQKNNHNN